MNGTLHYRFFFSYSRADWENDLFLERFFKDLASKVAIVTGAGTRKVEFRDEEGVQTGDDWTRKISEAVQNSDVLVCAYTPNFFSAGRTHEFCAKEFMAFLKRDPKHRYERVVDQGGCERYEVREARNILPILWLSETRARRAEQASTLRGAHDPIHSQLCAPRAQRSVQGKRNVADHDEPENHVLANPEAPRRAHL